MAFGNLSIESQLTISYWFLWMKGNLWGKLYHSVFTVRSFFRLQRPTNMDSLLIFNTLHTRLHFDLFRKTWWMLKGNRKKSLNRKQRPEGIRNTQNFMALATHNWFPNFYLKSWPERIWWFIWDLTINFLSIQESFWNCKNLHNDY